MIGDAVQGQGIRRRDLYLATLLLAVAVLLHGCLPRYVPMGTGHYDVLDRWTGKVCEFGCDRP